MALGGNHNATERDRLRELNDDIARQLVPAMVFVALLMVVGLAGNVVASFVFSFRLRMSTQHLLILWLAVFDLLSCSIAMPAEIADMRYFMLFESEVACRLLRFVNHYCSFASILTLIVIAADRYIKVCRPLRRQMSLRHTKMAVAAVLVVALALAIPSPVLYGIRTADTAEPGIHGHDCSTNDEVRGTLFPLVYNSILFLLFIVILIALTIIYVKIWREMRRHNLYMARNSTSRKDSLYLGSDVSFASNSDINRRSSETPSCENRSLSLPAFGANRRGSAVCSVSECGSHDARKPETDLSAVIRGSASHSLANNVHFQLGTRHAECERLTFDHKTNCRIENKRGLPGGRKCYCFEMTSLSHSGNSDIFLCTSDCGDVDTIGGKNRIQCQTDNSEVSDLSHERRQCQTDNSEVSHLSQERRQCQTGNSEVFDLSQKRRQCQTDDSEVSDLSQEQPPGRDHSLSVSEHGDLPLSSGDADHQKDYPRLSPAERGRSTASQADASVGPLAEESDRITNTDPTINERPDTSRTVDRNVQNPEPTVVNCEAEVTRTVDTCARPSEHQDRSADSSQTHARRCAHCAAGPISAKNELRGEEPSAAAHGDEGRHNRDSDDPAAAARLDHAVPDNNTHCDNPTTCDSTTLACHEEGNGGLCSSCPNCARVTSQCYGPTLEEVKLLQKPSRSVRFAKTDAEKQKSCSNSTEIGLNSLTCTQDPSDDWRKDDAGRPVDPSAIAQENVIPSVLVTDHRLPFTENSSHPMDESRSRNLDTLTSCRDVRATHHGLLDDSTISQTPSSQRRRVSAERCLVSDEKTENWKVDALEQYQSARQENGTACRHSVPDDSLKRGELDPTAPGQLVEDLEESASESSTRRMVSRTVSLRSVPEAVKTYKATVIATSVTVVFFLSFLPHLSLLTARIIVEDFDRSLRGASLVFYNIFLRSYFINSVANPLIYGVQNAAFRAQCLKLVRSWRSCCKRVSR